MTAGAWPAGHRIGAIELLEAVPSAAGFLYRGRDHSLGRPVAVEEYLPPAWARRNAAGDVVPLSPASDADLDRGLRLFADEARVLARCDHRALVRVLQLEQAHGTCYQVTPWYDARPLLDVPLQRGAPFNESELRALLDDVLGALDAYHHAAGVHGGIGAHRVLWLDSDRALLLGPGAAARAAGAASAADTGFAAPEQLPASSQTIGPWTDFHGLAAVARYCITGLLPAPAGSAEPIAATLERMHGATAAVRYHPALLRALDAALAPNTRRRPQTVQQFRQALAGATARASPVSPAPAQPAAAQAAVTGGPLPFATSAPGEVPAPTGAPPTQSPPASGAANRQSTLERAGAAAAAERAAAGAAPGAAPDAAPAAAPGEAGRAPSAARATAAPARAAAPYPSATAPSAAAAAGPLPSPGSAGEEEDVDAATLAAIRSVLDSIPDAPAGELRNPGRPTDGAHHVPRSPQRIDLPGAISADAAEPLALHAAPDDRPDRPHPVAAPGVARGAWMRWAPWGAAALLAVAAAGYAGWRWLPRDADAGPPATTQATVATDPGAARPLPATGADRAAPAATPLSATVPNRPAQTPPTSLPSEGLAPQTPPPAPPITTPTPPPTRARTALRPLCKGSGVAQQRCLQRQCASPRHKSHLQCLQRPGARRP